MDNLGEIKERLEKARDYLREYFNNSLDASLKESFILVFPDIDRASIEWLSGRSAIDYRLAFLPDGKMEWRCTLTSRNKTEHIQVVE